MHCITDTCNTEDQILLPFGICETCGEYTKPDDTNRNCIFPECAENEIMTPEAGCEPCEDYTHPDEELKECVSDTCN